MNERFKYLKKENRKKILLLADDIRLHSGVGTVAREIVVNTAHHFNWLNIGGALKNPDEGKLLDLSGEVNKLTGLTDSNVRILPVSGYGDPILIRSLLDSEKPDAIFIFTDPRYWEWLFDLEREIRSKIPIFYLNIWDDYPAPLYNKGFYESVDVLMAISKQTKTINELVLGDESSNRIIEYVPHGINDKHFYPIETNSPDHPKLLEFRKNLLKDKNDQIDFVVLFNSRNIRRKSVPDTILAYRHFCDKIGKEKARRCALVLHTAVVDPNGTDLGAVREALCDPDYVNVVFSNGSLSTAEMNYLYNCSDVTILLSANEGWGLSLTESMMAGKMIICNVTGGMQDQCRFEDDKGKWIDFSSNFPSNHRGTIKKCGEWARPVFPGAITIIGSPPTPYIFHDYCNPEDVCEALLDVYNLDKDDRKSRGLKGRNWALSEEAGLTVDMMCERIVNCMNKGFEKFKPRDSYEIFKVEQRVPKYLKHKLTDYSYE